MQASIIQRLLPSNDLAAMTFTQHAIRVRVRRAVLFQKWKTGNKSTQQNSNQHNTHLSSGGVCAGESQQQLTVISKNLWLPSQSVFFPAIAVVVFCLAAHSKAGTHTRMAKCKGDRRG